MDEISMRLWINTRFIAIISASLFVWVLLLTPLDSRGDVAVVQADTAAAQQPAPICTGIGVFCTLQSVRTSCLSGGDCTAGELSAIQRDLQDKCASGSCTSDEQSALARAQSGYTAARTAQVAKVSNVSACQSSDLTVGGLFECALGAFFVKVLSVITKLFTTLLDFSNYLFDQAIQYTVLNFQSLYSDAVAKNVGLVWTSVRDLANILIIGLFVFIAISIILGLQEFGQKKLIARVIIIATLINFSFLFTTIVINASNFFADTIYKGAQLAPTDGGTPKIAEKFKELLRVSTFDQAEQTYTDSYNSANGLLAALSHALVTVVFSALAIFVFLYGSLLLIARAVIFIVLLVLSAGAFATYLLPSLAQSEYGWSGWWHALLRNAFFAPVLMLFLMASLQISQALQSKGSIGAIVNNWNSAESLGAILSYLLILGILYAGIYISSHIASGMAQRLALVGAGLPVAIGSKVLANALQKGRGRDADMRAQLLGKQISDKTAQIAAMKDGFAKSMAMRDLSKLMRQKEKATATSKRSFDFMNTAIGQRLGKAAGLPDSLTKINKENYADSVHKQTKEAMDQAIQAAVTKESAMKKASEMHKDEGDTIKATHEEARSALKTAREAAQAAKDAGNLERDLATHRKAESDSIMNKERMQQEHDAPSTSAARKARLQTDMQREAQNIQNARTAATDITRRIRAIDSTTAAAAQKYQQAEAQLRNHNKKVQATAAEIASNTGKVAADMAVRLSGNKFTQMVRAASGGIIDLDSNASHHAREATEKRVGILSKVKAKKALEDALSKDDHGHGASGAKDTNPHP